MRADEIGLRQSVLLTGGLWLFTYLIFLLPSFADHGGLAWYGYPIIAAAVSLGVLLCVPLYLMMRAIREWPLWLRIIDAGLAAAAVAWLHSLLDAEIVDALRRLFAGTAPPPLDLNRIIDKFLTYIFIYEFYVTAIGLIMSAGRAHQREREAVEARAAVKEAQLAALRFQLNPHFLFNTLNAISSLVVTRRPEQAEEMLARLSDFLRASLSADPHGQVPLDEEVETLAAYLEIEGVRFGERLRFEVDVPPALADAQVPSFILQPLVENAVKYAVAPSRRGATIRVAARREADMLILEVADDGEGLRSEDQRVSTGVGLNNVRQRLGVLYDARASLVAERGEPGFRVELSIPLTGGGAAPGTREGRA